MSYLNKFSSLEERASAQIAISLCQESSFKEVALCLEKPTYGLYLGETSSPFFISYPMVLSVWAKLKEVVKKKDDQDKINLVNSYYKGDEEVEWDVAVHKQCLNLTEWLPNSLRHGISFWMSRIALEYLSFSRRQEEFFGVSRYFLMDILTRQDWMEDCRLDEEEIAKRMIQDERLTVLQRFRMTCVYCLYASIPALWIQLTREEKLIVEDEYSRHSLVVFWSRYMKTHENENAIQPQSNLWADIANEVVQHGNRAILAQCWKKLTEFEKQQLVIDLALQSLKYWQSAQRRPSQRETFSFEMRDVPTERFYLPSYYSELVRFFLTEMSEVELLTFFQKTFQETWQFYGICVLECLLDWPHQHNFLPIVRQLWGIIPLDMYGHCLLAVAKKYCGLLAEEKNHRRDCKKKRKLISLESHYCDYQSLISKLWKETPVEYKRYLFSSQELGHKGCLTYGGMKFFRVMLNRSTFNDKDEALFRQIWYDLLPEQKISRIRSKCESDICSLCVKQDRWSLLNSLIQESVPVEEIPIFRKKFIFSNSGNKFCLHKLKTREDLLEDLMGSSLELYYEKLIFECDVLDKKEYLDIFKLAINENELTDHRCITTAYCLSYGQAYLRKYN